LCSRISGHPFSRHRLPLGLLRSKPVAHQYQIGRQAGEGVALLAVRPRDIHRRQDECRDCCSVVTHVVSSPSVTCLHVLPRTIAEIQVCVTPYSSARSCCRTPPAAYRSRIRTTCSGTSRCMLCFTPRCARCRPRFAMSCELSRCVPGIKCAGLMHGGLSQVCRITHPSGIGPTHKV